MRILSFILAAIILPTSIIAQKITPRAKNILIIYSDDHSYHALGAAGNKEISTPNLDKLAKSGLMFTQAHVMGGHQGAVCIPSRAMLLTGRYVNRLPGDGNIIPDSIVSLPEVLRKQGYNTYHTGKWHSDKTSHSRMFSTGGDIFFGGMHFPKFGGQEHPTVSLFDSTGVYNENRKRISDIYSTTLYAENAIKFLSSSTAKSSPFFCYVAFTSPHDPRTPPGKFSTMYDPAKISLPANFITKHPFDNGDLNVRDEQLLPVPRDPEAIKKDIALYYGMVSEMDAQVGRILDALEKSGLKENTLIVFAGDNGLAVGQHGLLGKQNLYEHSIRVPMIMSGPGVPVNKKTEGFTYLSDITPTIIDYLAVKRPSSVEGRSLLPVIKDPSKKVRSSIYNVYGHWSRSIKSEDGFKMIVYNVDGALTTQLFNLKKDPLEINDLSKDQAYNQKILQMRALLKQQMTAAFDDLTIDLPDWGRTKNQKPRGS
ncbi:MAG: sulfatase-like hydrolase/transferase [Daejeonella sp.]|uniref:sulfatase-like hydrolase/transferase n=1 Tax=Daejeonella sp. TaxID=2805397 RepID=UPI002733EAC8|nr:sulfatase-like hydrolase/transferase [Daejeonella sp.]MDP3469809.1 sulfatase-like hydrolase/transferase [Daejeonella sp.]